MGSSSRTIPELDLHVDVDTERSALDCLSVRCELSRARIKQVMQCGAVWRTSVDGKRTVRLRRASATVSPGQQLHMYYRATIIDAAVTAPQCLADEGDYSVWFKPRGLLSQGSRYGDHHTVSRQAELVLNDDRPVLGVHRLDRYTSGLMLQTHSKRVQRQFGSLFANGQIDKLYWAIVDGVVPEGLLPKTMDSEVDGKPALSHCQLITAMENQLRSVVEVRIETGRKHQVRVHLAELGFPVFGDRQYGKSTDPADELQLYAMQLAFVCPITNTKRNYQLDAGLIPELGSLGIIGD